MKTDYVLECLGCGKIMEDDGLIRDCSGGHRPAFLRTRYAKKNMDVGREEEGIYRFADWLPIYRRLRASSAPVTFQSKKINEKLGLPNLWMTFNGYWPGKNARMMSGTFKECEAFTVCARLPEKHHEVLVVASAGNTARAFAKVCSENEIPLLLVVPENGLHNLWFDSVINRKYVKLVATAEGSDYYDAIHVSNLFAALPGFVPEGGAKNVARRDGMSTTVYSAVTTIGRIPDYYFQAVGSGTGSIAAWEANLRFIESGRYGNKKMRLMVVQNEPFVPMMKSWKAKSRIFLCPDEETSKKQIDKIDAKVLSNRKPPWGLTGGLFDALNDTKGAVLSATNAEAREAQALFMEYEKIDISSSAALALAALIKSAKKGDIEKDAVIMLNITGGGIECAQKELEIKDIRPDLIMKMSEVNERSVAEWAEKLFK